MMLLPSLVLRVMAISSAETRSMRASLPRSDSRMSFVLVAILKRRIGVKIAQVFQVPVQHQPRGRADIGGVQIEQAFFERILALHHLPVGFVAGIG